MAEGRIEAKFQLLAVSSKIIVKAFKAKSEKNLFFIIVNDTVHLFRYQRAVLFRIEQGKSSLLAISGHTDVPQDPENTRNWRALVESFCPFEEPQANAAAENPKEVQLRKAVHIPNEVGLLWVPIVTNDCLRGGLLLEERKGVEGFVSSSEALDILAHFIAPSYGAAWGRFGGREWIQSIIEFFRKKIIWFIGVLALLLFLVHVPLRIVAPCEVVPKDPIVISAPLEGIIEEVVVRPGQKVGKDETLFEYDKQVPLQNYAVAKKEVEILQSEVDRALTLGFGDERSLQELSVLELKLEKEKIERDLAAYQVGKLTVRAPDAGIVVIGNPHEWRGKPVVVGERVMELSDPQKTMVRIWIPESDNIPFDEKRPIKVYLNVAPERSYQANLNYVANESMVDEKGVVSFVAEADWEGKPARVKIGLKGTAVLFGERVTLFYWIIRRPWAYLRYLTGL